MVNLNKMYDGVVNSPETYLTQNLAADATIIYVADGSVFGSLPNLAVIGTDQTAETILVEKKRSDGGYNVKRSIEGNGGSWTRTTPVARNFTNFDYQQIKDNIEKLNKGKQESLTAGTNIQIVNGKISATDTKYNDTQIKKDITELQNSQLSKASQTEAESGVNNTKYMTPQATKQAIEKLSTNFTKLSQLEEDSTHRTVTDSEKEKWNKKFDLPVGKENQVLTKTTDGAEFKNISSSRSATFVIANYDSSENSKAGADYVIQENESPCDIINSFIKKLPGYGGKIQLTEGNFIEKNDKSINLNKDNITLSGYGIATKLEKTFKPTTIELIRILNSNIILKNLQIILKDNYVVKVFENTNNCKIYNIDTSSTNTHGFNIQGSNHRLLNCTVITNNAPAFFIKGSNHSLSNCSGTTAITTAFNIQGSGISFADCKGKNGSNSPCFWIKNKDHKFINCTVISSAEAFYIESSEISLIGCSLHSMTDHDIFCTSKSKNCIILANRFYGKGIYNSGTNNVLANNIKLEV